jgi:hypothetical protein
MLCGGVRVNAVALQHQLVHIWDETASISHWVALRLPLWNHFSIFWVFIYPLSIAKRVDSSFISLFKSAAILHYFDVICRDPLTWRIQHELMCSGNPIHGQSNCSSWSVAAHASCGHVSSVNVCELLTRPDTKNGSNSEIRVNDRGAIKWIKSDGIPTSLVILQCLLIKGHFNDLFGLLGYSRCNTSALFQSLEHAFIGE